MRCDTSLAEIIQSIRNEYRIEYPYIIAEAGVNHEGNMDTAKRLIDEASESGANAIKFQTYKANLIASKQSPAYWDLDQESTTSQFELFKKYDKFWKKEYEQLKGYCDECGIEFLSTPFDPESATFLNDLMPSFKISSSDLNNLPFIKFICGFKKPILLSVGASYMWEIERTAEFIASQGVNLSLLHCILNYPTQNENANLGMIKHLQLKFPEHIIGYSDHTLPENMETLKTATLLGARIIEKHFTHDKTLPGNDHYHAMDKHDLKLFHEKMQSVFTALGSFEKSVLESEKISRENARRGLVATKQINKGESLSPDNVTYKRPAKGISPENYFEIMGKKVLCTIEEDEFITWNSIQL